MGYYILPHTIRFLESFIVSLFWQERTFKFYKLEDIEKQLLESFKEKTGIDINQKGTSFSFQVRDDWEKVNDTTYIIKGELNHTHFVYNPITIQFQKIKEEWEASFTEIDDAEYLRNFFSKPLPLPFEIENIHFGIEYWTTLQPSITIWEIELNKKLSLIDIENIDIFFNNVVSEWNNYVSNLKNEERGYINFPPLIKKYGENAYRVKLDFEKMEVGDYDMMRFFIKKLADNDTDKLIKKLTFEWVI